MHEGVGRFCYGTMGLHRPGATALAALCLIALLGNWVRADEIFLKNGERLQGRIVGSSSGRTMIKLQDGQTRWVEETEIDRVVEGELDRGGASGEPRAPSFASKKSIQGAYDAIPHRRTVLDLDGSSMSAEDKVFLKRSFAAIDQAIVLRVTSLQTLVEGKKPAKKVFERLDRVIQYLEASEAPTHFLVYRTHLVAALQDQRDFLVEWRDADERRARGMASRLASHAKVRSASKALRKAYDILIARYPRAARQVKDAFFDYHCSLDFI